MMMELDKKNLLLILGILTIVCFGIAVIGLDKGLFLTKDMNTNRSEQMIDRLIPAGSIPSPYLASTGTVSIHTKVPELPGSIPIYKGTIKDGDKRDIILGDSSKKKTTVISEQDAPEAAAKALVPYGGLPPDAELGVSSTVYLEKFEPSTGEILERHPLYTVVSYHRKINGMPVGGQSDKIRIELGEKGSVLWIYKIWRTLEPMDTKVTIIAPEKAVDKLQNGQVLDPPLDVHEGIQIHTITLGYYEKSRTEPEIIVEPIWIFSGKTRSGFDIEYLVYARQFAHFEPTSPLNKMSSGKTPAEKDPFTVTFTDTSDAGPTKWQWDFGDGTTSKEKNPTHTYKNAGTYNVTLTVWNDLGLDTVTRQYTINAAPS